MRIDFTFLSLALMCNLHGAIAQVPPPVATPDMLKPAPARPGTPEQLLKQDIGDFIAKLNGAAPMFEANRWVWDARYGYFGSSEWQKWWLGRRGGNSIILEDIRVEKIDAKQAEIYLNYVLVLRRNDGGYDNTVKHWAEGPFLLKFVRPIINPGAAPLWQIVAQKPAENQTLIEHPVRWAIWALGQSSEAFATFRTALAQDNLRRLGQGVLTLVQDYDEVYALHPDFQEEALTPYLKDDAPWLVPGTRENFLFNGRLSGKKLEQIARPAQTILFYDGAGEKPIFRFDGQTAVCLADGHSEFVTPAQFKAFSWE